MYKHTICVLCTLIACGGGDKTSESGETTTPQTSGASSSSDGATQVTSSGTTTAGSASDSEATTVTSGPPGTGTSTGASTGPEPQTTGGEATTGTTTTTGGTTTNGEETSKGETTQGETTKGGETGDVCVDQLGSCAMGEACCPGLECCAGVPVPPGKEFCSDNCPISDRDAKTDIRAVDPAAVLRAVVGLEISTWSYKKDGPGVRHLGPMAQDFKRAFGLWDTDRMIFPLDASGVSLAAIQALHRRVADAEAESAELRGRLERVEAALAEVQRAR